MKSWQIRLTFMLLSIVLFVAGCGMAQNDQPPPAQYQPEAQTEDQAQSKARQQQAQSKAGQQQAQGKAIEQQQKSKADNEQQAPQQTGSAEEGKPLKKAEKEKPSGPQINKEVLEQARLAARQVDGVREVAAVAIDQDLSVAVNVAQMKRLQLKAIRKEIFHKLKKAHPEMTVHVTTDRKIFWEMEKLEKEAYAQKPKVSDMQKKLHKLNEDMKG